MNRTSFRTGFTGKQRSVRKFAAGFLVLGMAISASAKDGTSSGTATPASGSTPPITKAKPKASIKPKRWYQIGIASWYGMKFQGRTTAGGERFDMNGMTCAHRSLPLGTWLRVTNLRNHKTAYVRVNDRGPVPEDRIVDLSYAAAQSLGMGGLGQVRLEPISSNDPNLAQALLAQLQVPVVELLPFAP
jgi:rare lipoprotein A